MSLPGEKKGVQRGKREFNQRASDLLPEAGSVDLQRTCEGGKAREEEGGEKKR